MGLVLCAVLGQAQGLAATPANDHFANALEITGSRGQETGTNVGATQELGEPNHAGEAGGASVWWKWTAPASGRVVFNTFGSDFDTLLAVYTRDSVESLSPVASNDDSNGTRQSRVEFDAVAGTTYRIAVDGYVGNSGRIVLSGLLGEVEVTLVGQWPGFARDAALAVAVSGNYAYVADEEAGLQVIDVSDPANPVRVGGYDTPGSAKGVAVSGSYAYVADWDWGLQILRVGGAGVPVLPVFGSVRVLPDRSVEMEITASVGRRYVLEVSADLRNWVSLNEFVATNAVTVLRDTTASSQSHRFYRVVVP